MEGGLFEDKPLVYVGKPKDRRLEYLERIANMTSRLGEMRGMEMLAIEVGHNMGITPSMEFIEYVKESCKKARAFAIGCADASKEENRKGAYKVALSIQCSGIMKRLEDKWGTQTDGKGNSGK